MDGDIVIRGGTLVDGTGTPGRPADVAVRDGRIVEIGSRLHGDRVLDAGGTDRRTRVHRHPQSLRRTGLLGPGAHAVLVPRRDERRRGELRFSIAPINPDNVSLLARTLAERRGHELRHVVGGGAVGRLRDISPVPRRYRAQGRCSELRLLRRAHRGAAVRDGRGGIRGAARATTSSKRCKV